MHTLWLTVNDWVLCLGTLVLCLQTHVKSLDRHVVARGAIRSPGYCGDLAAAVGLMHVKHRRGEKRCGGGGTCVNQKRLFKKTTTFGQLPRLPECYRFGFKV